jgi:hypothetical protein
MASSHHSISSLRFEKRGLAVDADCNFSIQHNKGGTMPQKSTSNSGQVVLELSLKPVGGWGDEPEEEVPPFFVNLDVSPDDALRFPDVVPLIFEINIDEDDESDEASDALVRQVIDFVEHWIRDNHVQAIGEIEAAVLRGFVVIDCEERSTESQRTKFDQFSRLLDADEIIESLLEIVACTELTDDELGETWGITLCPEEKVLARVNTGSGALAEVLQSGRGLVFRIMVIGEFEIPGFIGDSAFLNPGFESVEGSVMVSVLSERLLDLIDLPGVDGRVAAHAAIGDQKLPRTSWHNPMSEILLFAMD